MTRQKEKEIGSEYPAIVTPLMIQHFLMLKRNLHRYHPTRGKKLVVMIGEKKALAIAAKDHQTTKSKGLANKKIYFRPD